MFKFKKVTFRLASPQKEPQRLTPSLTQMQPTTTIHSNPNKSMMTRVILLLTEGQAPSDPALTDYGFHKIKTDSGCIEYCKLEIQYLC